MMIQQRYAKSERIKGMSTIFSMIAACRTWKFPVRERLLLQKFSGSALDITSQVSTTST